MNSSEIIKQFKEKRVLVIGDFMLDKYAYGTVSRISPEAPVPVLHYQREEDVPGGAGNVAHNLASLGASVIAMGITGDDTHRTQLLTTLQKHNINCNYLLPTNRPTSVKHRLVSGNHQLLRVDYEDTSYIQEELQRALIKYYEDILPTIDAIVVADYAKGMFPERFAREVVFKANQAKKFIIVDTKPKHMQFFKNISVLKINAKEAKEMTQKTTVEEAGPELRKLLNTDVVISRGGDGISVFNYTHTHIPTKVQYVFDVTGAGDTVNAVLTLAKISGASLVEAATLANIAGSIVVQKPATAVVTQEELIAAATADEHTVQSR